MYKYVYKSNQPVTFRQAVRKIPSISIDEKEKSIPNQTPRNDNGATRKILTFCLISLLV